jgi:hypothetical protein
MRGAANRNERAESNGQKRKAGLPASHPRLPRNFLPELGRSFCGAIRPVYQFIRRIGTEFHQNRSLRVIIEHRFMKTEHHYFSVDFLRDHYSLQLGLIALLFVVIPLAMAIAAQG